MNSWEDRRRIIDENIMGDYHLTDEDLAASEEEWWEMFRQVMAVFEADAGRGQTIPVVTEQDFVRYMNEQRAQREEVAR